MERSPRHAAGREKPSFLFGLRKHAAEADMLVNATPGQIWRVVTDIEKVAKWWPRALGGSIVGRGEPESEPRSKPGSETGSEAGSKPRSELGREQAVRLAWGKREGVITQRVTMWEPDAKYGWTVVREAIEDTILEPIAVTNVTISVTPERGISRVKIAGTFDPVGLKGAMTLRQVVRAARSTYRRALKNLDSLMQQTPAG